MKLRQGQDKEDIDNKYHKKNKILAHNIRKTPYQNISTSKINKNKANGFENAVNSAIRRQSVNGVQFNSNNDGTIQFLTQTGDKAAVACIIAIDKQ